MQPSAQQRRRAARPATAPRAYRDRPTPPSRAFRGTSTSATPPLLDYRVITPRSSSTRPGYRSSRGAKQDSKTAARRIGTRVGRRGHQQLSRLPGTASRIAISRPSASRAVVVLGSYIMRNRCPPGWRPPVQMQLDEGRVQRHAFVQPVGPASSAARRSRRKDPASRRGVTTQMQARFGPGASQDLPRRPPGLEMNWAVAREPTIWPSSRAA